MALNAGAILLSMTLISSVTLSPMWIIAIISATLFVKGTLWPAVGAMVAEVMAKERQDTTFMGMGLASRCGSTFHSAVLGISMAFLHLSWKRAAQVLIAAICVGLVVVHQLMTRLSNTMPARDPDASLQGLHLKISKLCTSVQGWLAFATCLGQSSVWAMSAYLSVILRDVLNLSVGEAAGKVFVFPMGAACGLIANVAISAYLSRHVARRCQTGLASVATATLAILANWVYALSEIQMLCLLWLVGFSFVVTAYLPYLAFCAASNGGERAFRLGVLDGVSCLCSVLLVFALGKYRASHLENYAGVMFACASAGLSIAVIAMHFLFRSLDELHDDV